MEYIVVVGESCADLAEAVRENVSEGWRPQGGIAVGYRDEWEQHKPESAFPRVWTLPKETRKMYWTQAMVREGETK